MGSESKVFAFLLPAWGTDFVLSPNWDGEAGAWAVTTPPQEYNWGGSYVHAATGTDNTEHVKGRWDGRDVLPCGFFHAGVRSD